MGPSLTQPAKEAGSKHPLGAVRLAKSSQLPPPAPHPPFFLLNAMGREGCSLESPQTSFDGVFKASYLSEWVPRALKMLSAVTLCDTLGFCSLYCSGSLMGVSGNLCHQPRAWVLGTEHAISKCSGLL